MGMFDSVNVRCPACSYYVEFQSKAGACKCFSFDMDSVPTKIAADITGNTEVCTACDSLVEVKEQSQCVSMVASITK